jgi:hypothetical protein
MLHHFPPPILKKLIGYWAKVMRPGEILIAQEPRYDHPSFEMAALIYALRLALPNYFCYLRKKEEVASCIRDILDEIRERHKKQSELDGESPSDFIVKTIRNNFKHVELSYSTAFFDKIIASFRIKDEDAHLLSGLLKQLDEVIIKYNPAFASNLKIKAIR